MGASLGLQSGEQSVGQPAIACEKRDYLAWQKNFPRSVPDRAPGMLVETIRRKAESAGRDRLFEYTTTTTAVSQTCLCGDRKKSLSPNGFTAAGADQRTPGPVLRQLGLHVRTDADGLDRLGLEAANHG